MLLADRVAEPDVLADCPARPQLGLAILRQDIAPPDGIATAEPLCPDVMVDRIDTRVVPRAQDAARCRRANEKACKPGCAIRRRVDDVEAHAGGVRLRAIPEFDHALERIGFEDK